MCIMNNAFNAVFPIRYCLKHLLPAGTGEEIGPLLGQDNRQTRKQAFLSHNVQKTLHIFDYRD